VYWNSTTYDKRTSYERGIVPDHHAIDARGLGKRYGELWALQEFDLAVPAGTVCGLLGPNGAGKTTAVKVMTTLLRPDTGSCRVAGFDVVADAHKVRARIGLAGQQAAVDELLTGRSNLDMVGRLYHLGAKRARARAEELLERFALTDAADRLARTYSGGMRRRLDLAASLVAAPPVLFLDEPTTGLDPHSRNELWAFLRELLRDGTTLLLTTQYLEEADQLADDIVVVDHGHVVATGTPDSLKSAIGGTRIDVVVPDELLVRAAGVLGAACGEEPTVDRGASRVTVNATGTTLASVVRALDANGVPTDDVTVRKPSLDDVFLTLTGRTTEEAA
jgi:ABC-2 type transport system ATP-binding protein